MPPSPFANLLRSAVVFLGCVVVLVAILALEGWSVAAHAAALWSALQALGTDPTPLAGIPLIGSVYAGLGADAGLAEVIALVLAAGEFTLAFALAKLLLRLIKGVIGAVQEHYRHRVGWLEFDWAEIAVVAFVTCAAGAFLLCLLIADWQLYVFRTDADALDGTVAAWSSDAPGWFRALAQATAYAVTNAYVIVFLGGALIMALLFHRIDDTFERLSLNCRLLWRQMSEGAAPAAPQMHYGYDADGEPVFDPDRPIAFHPDGTPVGSAPAAPAEAAPAAAVHADPAPPPAATAAEAPSPAPELVAVVTAAGNRQMPLAQVEADTGTYCLDLATGQWWERALWEALHGKFADAPPQRDAA